MLSNNDHNQRRGNRSNFLPILFIILIGWIALDKITPFLFKDRVELKAVTPPPSELGSDERATIQVFDTVSPSVVFITNKRLQRSLFSFNVQEVTQGSGSGFVWDKNGHIVTNFHVIYQATEVEITFQDGAIYDATLVGVDPDHDLAVLKIDAPSFKLRPVLVGSSSQLKVGQKVLAIGNPFGLNSTLTTGIVSALGRSINSMSGRTIHDVIQTDAAINPGNSGGPLLDSFGRVVGINTSIVSPSGASAGIGFAVPIDTVNYIAAKLIVNGKIDRPGMGIMMLPDNIVSRLNIRGAPIFRVLPGSAAEKSGLYGVRETRDGMDLGDIITEIEGLEIATNEDLISAIDRFKVGDRISVTVMSDKGLRQVVLQLEPIR